MAALRIVDGIPVCFICGGTDNVIHDDPVGSGWMICCDDFTERDRQAIAGRVAERISDRESAALYLAVIKGLQTIAPVIMGGRDLLIDIALVTLADRLEADLVDPVPWRRAA